MLQTRAAVPGISGGRIDLEQIEGKSAVGGITIPSPWDRLLQVKLSAPKSVQREALLKAHQEAEALTDGARHTTVEKTLIDVFARIEAQLPVFETSGASIEALPDEPSAINGQIS